MQNVKEVVEDETVILVLGNKCDMINNEKDKHEADNLKHILNVENVLSFHCSAKTGENIKESFQLMAKNLMSKENNDLKSSIKLENSLKKKGCCNRWGAIVCVCVSVVILGKLCVYLWLREFCDLYIGGHFKNI